MEKIDVYKVAAGVAVVAVISWILSLESLFVLGIVITLALAVMCGIMIGVMGLAERVSAEFAHEKAHQGQWKNMQTGARVSHR